MSIIQIRKFAEKSYLTVFMALLLTVTSCSKEQMTSNVNRQKLATASLSGENIFTGIFFFQGDLSNKISSLKPISDKIDVANAQNPVIKENLKVLADEMVSIINRDYPNFFNNFKSKMNSGDLFLMKEAIK